MSVKNKINKLLKKATIKYRFVVMTDDSFEERVSVKFNRLRFFLLFLGVFTLVFSFSFFIIANTSMKNLIPGMSQKDLEKEVLGLSVKSDSLITVLGYHDLYLTNLENIITGNLVSFKDSIDDGERLIDVSKINFINSTEDSLFRQNVEEEEKGVLLFNQNRNSLVLFFPPVSGVITDRFNPSSSHYGIDLVTKENAKVSSVLPGTIVVSEWNPETGHTIGIQHKDGYLSFYKHNSVLLCSSGDYVKGGEHIAIVGDSGKFSSGPHLHFELWHNGTPVNPENYILF
jgi:hypothetical protein